MGTDKVKNEIEIVRESGGYASGNLYECMEGNIKKVDKRISIFDKNTYNFHLCPEDENTAIRIAKDIGELRERVMRCLKEKGYEEVPESEIPKEKNNMIYISKGAGSRGGNGEYHGLFKYILAKKNSIKYELNFMRFFISKDNKVHCILKAIQFDRCMDNRNDSGVNYDKGKCRVCYPTSYQSQAARRDKIIEKNSKESLKSFCYNPDVSFYYNPQDEEKTTKNARLIAKAFIDFINECEKTTYIAHKSILSPACSNQYYLKLNRTAQSLEVYEQADNHLLRELYPLREDFDTSDYILFTLKKSIPCIFGGEGRTRTPAGIFRIEHVSGLHEEYVSPYHPQHEQVKFFGYLAVFEDYFIHSNMYLTDATGDNFHEKEPVSEQDTHTSGCIRVPQEELDWLVEHVPEGTTIAM